MEHKHSLTLLVGSVGLGDFHKKQTVARVAKAVNEVHEVP